MSRGGPSGDSMHYCNVSDLVYFVTNMYSVAMTLSLDHSHRPSSLTPFLKWAGGKRWLAPLIEQKVGEITGRYIEPFLGGGAVFFRLLPGQAILNDANANLIETYRAIQADHLSVKRHLDIHHRLHSVDYYYKMRSYLPRCQFRKAARFIYLNRTCWNGLYRVNLKGAFNVPIGTKTKVTLETDDWANIAGCLAQTELMCGDFEDCIDRADIGDVVFADPPYTVKHNYNGFIKYNECLFSWCDQERLSRALARAANRGVIVVATNANHESVRSLYQTPEFDLHTLSRNSVLSGDPKYRGQFQELLIASKSIW